MTAIKILGAILAGGRSKRMGRQKPFVPLAGKPLVQHGIDRLRAQTDELIINANEDLERYETFGCPILQDSVSGHPGPLIGVLDALVWAQQSATSFAGVVTLPCDVPFIPETYVTALAEGSQNGSRTSYAKCPSGHHYLCAYWPLAVSEALQTYVGDGRAKVEAFHALAKGVSVDFGHQEFDHFFNINRPEDVMVAEQMLISHNLGEAE